MDIISKLPPTIIEYILCLVPIQEAGRTSILSKEWRYHWTKIPKLVFDEGAFQVSSYLDEPSVLEEALDNIQSQRKGMTKRCKFFYAIYQVLLKHEGPIDEFTLSMRSDETCVEIDHVIYYLLRTNTIKKLTLHMVGGYRLPSSFFLFDHLTDLYLYSCDFDHQPTFKGFYDLTNLFMEMYTDDIRGIGDSTIIDLFECFPMVENLCFWLMAVECFAKNGVPRVLRTELIHLKYLLIDHMNFEYIYGLPILLFLIRSSPNMEILKLQIYEDPWFVEHDPEKRSFTLGDYSDIWLGRLNEIEIFNLSNGKQELDFVKNILVRSPVLKKVRIFLWKDIDKDDEMQVSRIILYSQRASQEVEITVERNN